VRAPEKGSPVGDTSEMSLGKGVAQGGRFLEDGVLIKNSKLRRKEGKEERTLQCLYPLAPSSFPDCHMLLPSRQFLLAARKLDP
jgi:hypothetical protein